MRISWKAPKDRFLRQVLLLGDRDAEDALGRAVFQLSSHPWDPSLPIEVADAARNRFAYGFHPGYELVFRRLPLRNARGALTGIEIQLVALHRVD